MRQSPPPDVPVNEPNLAYLPGSPERGALKAELARMAADRIDIPLVIGGASQMTPTRATVVMPHNHGHVLGDVALAAELALPLRPRVLPRRVRKTLAEVLHRGAGSRILASTPPTLLSRPLT